MITPVRALHRIFEFRNKKYPISMENILLGSMCKPPLFYLEIEVFLAYTPHYFGKLRRLSGVFLFLSVIAEAEYGFP